MAEKQFNLQSNYGWGLSLNMTGKAPEVAKRIFNTYNDAFAYADDINDSAIEGLTLTVVNDSDKNGVYFVKSVRKPSIIAKLEGDDIKNLSGKTTDDTTFSSKTDAEAWADTLSSYTDCFNVKDEDKEKVGDFSGRGKICKVSSDYYEVRQLKCDVTELVKLSTAADSVISADAVQQNLNVETQERKEADNALSGAINTAKTELSGAINTAKTELSGAIDTAKTELSGAIDTAKTELNEAIEAVSSEVASAKTELNEAIASAKTELNEAIEAVSSEVASAKTELNEAIASAKTELNEAIEAVSGDVIDLEEKVDNHISATTEALNALKIKDVKADDKVLSVSTDGLLSSALSMDYVASAKTIYLKGIDGAVISEVDATEFIKDGMLNMVELVTEGGKTDLVFSFNTDSGKDIVKVDVTTLLNGTELDNLQLALDAHINSANTQHFRAEERAKFDALMMSYDADKLTEKFTAINDSITANTKNISDVSAKATTNETNINTVSGDVKTLTETVNTNHSAFTAYVATHEVKVQEIENSISDLSSANTAAHEAISGAIDTAKTELSGAIDTAKTELSGDIDTAKTELNGEIASAKTELSGAIDTAKSELNGEIASANTRIDNVENSISELNSANTAAHEALQSAINKVESDYKSADITIANNLSALNEKVNNNEEVAAAALTDLQKNKVSSISAVENSNISIVENKDDNGVTYQIDFTWLEF